MAVGVKPWSASATSTASNTRVCEGVGRRIATSQKASSPKPTFPIRSAVRSWPSSRISSALEVPSEVGNFAVLLHGGLSRAAAFRWNLFSGLGSVIGGVIGYFALSAVEPLLPVALAISAAGLLYVAVADLIPGLHRRVDARTSFIQVLLIALGVLVVAMVAHVGGH